MQILRHVLAVGLGIFLCLGVPLLRCGVNPLSLLSGTADAVSGATVEPPDSPSGNYVILLNRSRHPDSIPEWRAFFREEPVGVIMEDLVCMTPASDVTGRQLAERYQLRLAENQMKLKPQDGLLLVSRAEHGLFDVIVLSEEMEAHYDYSRAEALPETEVIRVSGGAGNGG